MSVAGRSWPIQLAHILQSGLGAIGHIQEGCVLCLVVNIDVFPAIVGAVVGSLTEQGLVLTALRGRLAGATSWVPPVPVGPVSLRRKSLSHHLLLRAPIGYIVQVLHLPIV